MKVKLIFDAQFCGYAENIVELPDDCIIEEVFEEHMGIPFDHNCDYEILD